MAWLAVVVVVIALVLMGLSMRSAAVSRAAAGRARTELDRHRARNEAEEHELAARDAVLGAMQEGVVLFDARGGVRFSNSAAQRHLPTLPPTSGALLPLGLREAVGEAGGGRTSVAEVQVGTPARWIRGTALPVEPYGSVLLVLADVTETKRADSVRRDFVANASHELKTPAASIQATAETIRTAVEDDPAVVPRFAAQLEREAARLSRIVADLLDLSRLEAGTEIRDVVRIDGVIREERERAEEAASRAGVALAVDVPDDVPPIQGSARDFSLLVRNLVDNAIRYTRPGGRVDVRLWSEGGDVVLTVADTGVGIPTRDLDRIFERFYRVDRARSRETGGTGLGLSIVRHVIENHGGSIDVRSELGRGTTVDVRLPVAVG
jgi:two-component system, OmpR family, sensor histidine kinase SenX3